MHLSLHKTTSTTSVLLAKVLKTLFVFTLLFSAISCDKEPAHNTFKSNFEGLATRTWIGPQYWANPLQDWQIKNDRIECLVSNENRNIHHLTRQLGEKTGTLDMKVSLGLLNTEQTTNSHHWVGFSIGARGEFDDYRNHAVFGKGLNVGVGTNGALFIGQQNKNNKNTAIIAALKEGVDLQVTLTPIEGQYNIDLSIYATKSQQLLASISKKNVAPEKLIGDLVLMSDFKNGVNKRVQTKSVWFKDWTIKGTKVLEKDEQQFGPILFSQYTMSRNTVKLTAQMAPIDHPTKKVSLQLFKNDAWETISEMPIDKSARTAMFKLENWDDSADVKYRLVYLLEEASHKTVPHYWEGTIRKNPIDKKEISIAGFTGNNDLGFPNTDIYEEVKLQDPDILFFSGDQIYEEVGGYYIQLAPLEASKLDYLRKWYLFGWAYRDILKNRPTVCLTDDHDMYMGNIWGESGRKTPITTGHRKHIQDSGGYRMPAAWVNMVEKTQTSHLPDPYDPSPVKQGIGVYYTQMNYGRISFAILEDRKFKSAPKALLPNAGIVNGWPENKAFNMEKNGDVKGASLLGKRQLDFLENWAADWSYGATMKTLLSQTIFANVATLPKAALSDVVVPTLRIMREGDYPVDDQPVGDLDSNGWPQTGRNNAVKTIRKAFAFHLAGDQHLGSTIQYGVDDWNDSGYAFCVPSISNYWPRRWYPQAGGKNSAANAPKYTGEFKDGFGNKFTVKAISNPLFTGKTPAKLYDRAAGYGIVKFNKSTRNISLNCWPRGSKSAKGDQEQYPGWPITIHQLDNYMGSFKYQLPGIKITGLKNAVLQVSEEQTQEIIYTIRLNGDQFSPKVPSKGTYRFKIGNPDSNTYIIKKNIKASLTPQTELTFDF
ncbi:MAG: alkaline phosphatase D family protein [Flavobacteriaceae bacterium]|nr:alkaline phosphatase D family protein [Flavobacteriaceae bacterium]